MVQFLGAVTQSSPMMIVTEYLPKVLHINSTNLHNYIWQHFIHRFFHIVKSIFFDLHSLFFFLAIRLKRFQQKHHFEMNFRAVCFQGDLRAYLNRKGALKPIKSLRFAMDIARFTSSLCYWPMLWTFFKPQHQWFRFFLQSNFFIMHYL